MEISIIPINTVIDIHPEDFIKEEGGKIDSKETLRLNAYVEEKSSRHITIHMSPDPERFETFDVWLDIDIYQAEVLGKGILALVEQRKKYIEEYNNQE